MTLWLSELQERLNRWSLHGSLVGLVLIILFQQFQLALWIRGESRPPSEDSALHLAIAFDYEKAAVEGNWNQLLNREFVPPTPPFPPLYHLSLMFAMGEDDPARSALWANGFYLALLCLSVWGIGRRAGGNWVGLAAAVLVSCLAEIQVHSRMCTPDLALGAWVAAAYWALAESDSFRHKGFSALFACLFAAAMLTKWSAFTYLLPAFWIAAVALTDSKGRIGVLISASVAAFLITPWYYSQSAIFLPRLVEAALDAGASAGGASSSLDYVKALASGLETPLFVYCLYVIGSGNTDHNADRNVWLSWLGGAILFWTLVPRHDPRYLLPALAPLVILAASSRQWKITAGLCAFQLFSAVNFGQGWIPTWKVDLGIPLTVFRTLPPSAADWKLGEILLEIDKRRDEKDSSVNLTIMGKHPYFNESTFNWESKRRGIKKIGIRRPISSRADFSEYILMKLKPSEFSDIVEVELGKEGQMSIKGDSHSSNPMIKTGNWFRRGYKAITRWSLPDGTEAVLFSRRKIIKRYFRERVAFFQYYEVGPLIAEQMALNLGRWDGVRGVYPRVQMQAKKIKVFGLEVEDLQVEMEDVTLMSAKDDQMSVSYVDTSELLLHARMHQMRRLKILSGVIREKNFEEFLKRRISDSKFSGFKSMTLDLSDNIKISGTLLNILPISLEASAEISPNGRGVDMALEKVRIANILVPINLLFNQKARYTVAFDLQLPFEVEVEIGNLEIKDGRITILRKKGNTSRRRDL